MNYFSRKANLILPYIPGEQPKDGEYIKLNTNENPYPPSDKVKKSIKRINFDKLRLYPDPECNLIKRRICKYFGSKKRKYFCWKWL